MKKTILGAAFFLLIGACASAAGLATEKGQPRVERNILSTQLPAQLLTNIKHDYKGYWITECAEKGKKKQADYFITVENADQIVQLRSTDAESWVVTNTSVKVE